MLRLAVLASVSVLALATSAGAATTTVFVPGSANPNFSGLTNVSCCSGDTSALQPPLLALTGFAAGSQMTFLASGQTDGAGTGPEGPDGRVRFNMINYGLGVAPALNVRVLGLLGVFLGTATPTAATQPASLNFQSGLNFASLSPGIGQMFWIGDGLTGTGSGATQVFSAPTGATRLYLGTVDGFGWNNNTGGYNVTINYQPQGGGVVPEPATWALMITGFGLAGGALRRRRLFEVAA